MSSSLPSRLLLPSSKALAASFSSASSPLKAQSFSLPSLAYDYGALEPAISGQIMETHHKKHHQAYVTNLNNLLGQYAEAESKGDVAKQIQLSQGIKFNGGGHLNHSIFWTNLAPIKQGGGSPPEASSLLSKYIQKDFGGLDQLKAQLTAVSLGVQGSGWGWLGYNKAFDRLEVVSRPNQDPLVELVPLLGIDVWEHAYYYVYGPARAEYLKNIWTVVNWQNVAERLDAARK